MTGEFIPLQWTTLVGPYNVRFVSAVCQSRFDPISLLKPISHFDPISGHPAYNITLKWMIGEHIAYTWTTLEWTLHTA
jgi:hypothetical protein